MTRRYIESGITFEFDEKNWNVCQYDATDGDYRKNVHLSETKAVDFVGIYNKNSIVFFEIKSFQGYGRQTAVQNRLSNSMEDLSTEIAQKVRDTVAVIAGLNRTVPLNLFWKESEQIIFDKSKQIIIIAWIEEDFTSLSLTEKKRRKSNLSTRKDKLKQKLSWLTSDVYIENIRERNFNFEGFNTL